MPTPKPSNRRKVRGQDGGGMDEECTCWYDPAMPYNPYSALFSGKLQDYDMKELKLEWVERDVHLLWPALNGKFLEYTA